MNDPGKASGYIALFSEIGYWLDQHLGTIPIFVLVGCAGGTVSGAIGCWRLMSRFLEQMDEDDRS